jgi:hypothetical protein
MLNNWSNRKKLAVVVLGYAAAPILAFAGASLLSWAKGTSNDPGGMAAFGDLLGFIGLLGILSLPPTALALYFLRPFAKFWTIFSIASLSLATLGVVSAALMGKQHLPPWSMLLVGFFGLVIVLGAPLLGISFLGFAWLAPKGSSRSRLIAAATIEFAVCAYATFCMVVVRHWLV